MVRDEERSREMGRGSSLLVFYGDVPPESCNDSIRQSMRFIADCFEFCAHLTIDVAEIPATF